MPGKARRRMGPNLTLFLRFYPEGVDMFFRKVAMYALVVPIVTIFLMIGCQKDVNALQAAPDFALKDLGERTLSLAQFRGRIVVLDFWATWCPPCRMSIPELVKLQKEFKDQGLVIIGISLDDPALVTNASLRSFKQKFKMNYSVLRYDLQIMKDYFGTNSPAIPTMFVIDREGKIRDKLVGYRDGALRKSIKALLQ
ncbi:MAG: TlpA disulfide reductase family protein [Desulfatiglandaceae bacterium]